MSGEYGEPWEADGEGYVFDRKKALVLFGDEAETAARLVACVNACASVPRPEGIGEVVRRARADMADHCDIEPMGPCACQGCESWEFVLRALGLDPDTGEETPSDGEATRQEGSSPSGQGAQDIPRKREGSDT